MYSPSAARTPARAAQRLSLAALACCAALTLSACGSADAQNTSQAAALPTSAPLTMAASGAASNAGETVEATLQADTADASGSASKAQAPSSAGMASLSEFVGGTGEAIGTPENWEAFKGALSASLGVDCSQVQQAPAGTQLDDTMVASGAVYLTKCAGTGSAGKAVGAVYFDEEADVKDGLASLTRSGAVDGQRVIGTGRWYVLVSKAKDQDGTLALAIHSIVGGDLVR